MSQGNVSKLSVLDEQEILNEGTSRQYVLVESSNSPHSHQQNASQFRVMTGSYVFLLHHNFHLFFPSTEQISGQPVQHFLLLIMHQANKCFTLIYIFRKHLHLTQEINGPFECSRWFGMFPDYVLLQHAFIQILLLFHHGMFRSNATEQPQFLQILCAQFRHHNLGLWINISNYMSLFAYIKNGCLIICYALKLPRKNDNKPSSRQLIR